MLCQSSRLLVILASAAAMLSCGGAPQDSTTTNRQDAPATPPEITHFYASPARIPVGEQVQICYGVLHTDSLRIDPEVKDLKPGRSRCFSVSPEADTQYTLFAEGPGGSATAQAAVQVNDPTPAAADSTPEEQAIITTFLASPSRVPRGSRVTICYALEGAESVSLDPPVLDLEPVSRCFTHMMQDSTTFTLTASADGRTETRTLLVSVY